MSNGQDIVYQIVFERIEAALKRGTVPWHKPWTGVGGLPRSMSSGKAYRGSNVLVLGLNAMANGYSSPFWGTYKHIAKLGGRVRKDQTKLYEIATFWKRFTRTERNEAGENEEKSFMMLRYYRVYNAEQADGLPERFYPKAAERTPVEIHKGAQELYDAYLEREKITLRHGGSRAFYQMGPDVITLPDRDSFDTTEDYYDVLGHEAGHSTGHKDRLARPGVEHFDHFGSERYSAEELVAEITGAMLNAVLGIETEHVQENNAAYIASWLRKLQDDPKLVVQAAAKAQKAADLIQDITFGDEGGDAHTE